MFLTLTRGIHAAKTSDLLHYGDPGWTDERLTR